MVVTIGTSMAAFVVALASGSVIWTAVIYSVSGGVCAYIAIWLYFLVIAPSHVYDKTCKAKQKALEERDRIRSVIANCDEWDEKDDLLSRSIELGRQIEQDCHPEQMGDYMRRIADRVAHWVLEVYGALERVDPKWAESFSTDGFVNLSGAKWKKIRHMLDGYIRRLEEIRSRWALRHPSKLSD